MLKRFFILLFILSFFHTKAQTPAIDSLQKLASSSGGTKKIDVLNELAFEYRHVDPAQTLSLAKLTLELSGKEGYVKGEISSLHKTGVYYYRNSDLKTALDFFNQSLQKAKEANDTADIALNLAWKAELKRIEGKYKEAIDEMEAALPLAKKVGDLKLQAYILMNIGTVLDSQSMYTQALENFTEALKLAQQAGDRQKIAYLLISMGGVYFGMNDYDKALKYYKEALPITIAIKDRNREADNLCHIAALYHELGQEDTALAYFEKALFIGHDINDKLRASYCLESMGYVALAKKEADKALDYFDKALAIAAQINYNGRNLMSNTGKAEAYFLKRNFPLAISFGERGLTYARQAGGFDGLRNASLLLYNIYSAYGNYKKALEMHVLFKQMEDSIYNEENVREQAGIEMNYLFYKKAITDSIRRATLERQEKLEQQQRELQQNERIKRQQILLYSGIVMLLIISGFAFYLYRLNSQKKQINAELAEQKKIVEKKNLVFKIQNKKIEEANAEITQAHKEITDGIHYARHIQSTLLPSPDVLNKALRDHFILYQPKEIISGDFYWLSESARTGNPFLLATADCTGHGVPGAFVSMLGINHLNSIAPHKPLHEPHFILDELRKHVAASLNPEGTDGKTFDGMDISLCFFDRNKKQVNIASAMNSVYIFRPAGKKGIKVNGKQQIPVKYNNNGTLYEINADKSHVGRFIGEPRPYTLKQVEVEEGDCVYTLTDGFSDQFGGEENKKFKSDNFELLLLSIGHEAIDKQKELLLNAHQSWKGNKEQTDDILVIGVRV